VEVVSLIVDVFTVIAVAAGVVLWRSFKAGAEQLAKDQASELSREINRAAQLARQLEQTRGIERQELRFTSYGKLWAEMRPLAIYDESPVNRDKVKEMSKKLSDWYFSPDGGLLLTSHNRDLYFALQGLVSDVGATTEDWHAERISDPAVRLRAILERRTLDGARALLDHLDGVAPADWPTPELEQLARAWRRDLVMLASGWSGMNAAERFAVLQQACSVLRTGLTYDVESRLR
jgi:hypothetical protein